MDPLSIAGLTLAVLDQLWKTGRGTAQLVSDYRDFDNDSTQLVHKIQDENNWTRALRMLLFEASPVYEGRSLFEQFDADVREEIYEFLEVARDVVEQAYQLLYRRQERKITESNTPPGPKTMSDSSSVSSDLTLSPASEVPLKRPRSFQKLRWSLRDKKRVEQILQEFTELNGRIHESIKLWCLGTSIGVNMQHLKRLQDGASSQALGFDIDAGLQIAVSQHDSPPQSLEVDSPELRAAIQAAKPIGDGTFRVLNYKSSTVLIEQRSYAFESPVPVEMDSRTHELVDKLASLLHQPKGAVLRTPSCQGWIQSSQQNTVAFMFSIPDAVETSPSSLLSVLQSTGVSAPSLGSRFWLAVRLAKFVSQLHLVKWVHESFRSENILFFPHKESQEVPGCSTAANQLDVSKPWILGFEFSRPETYFSNGHGDMCLSRDVYRHPDRQKHPSKVFNKIHDVYALGVVLLEIGLWQPVLSLEKSGFSKTHDPNDIKKHLLKHAEKRLGNKMGDRYKNVVVTCLKGSFEVQDDTKEDLKLQLAFRSQVVETLQRSAENV